MSSADYWKKREQEAKKATIRDEEEYRKRIETIYKQTYEAVERQINDWYARYASRNGLSMSEARMRVKKLDMERYERLAAKYVATHDFSDQANEEMEIYNLTMRINRLELLKAQINLELLAGYDDLDKELEREFIEQAMKEDRRLAGILGDSVIGNQRYAKQIVNVSFWNATYSERIWGNNMPRLRSSIETQLRNGIIQGIHSTELARNLRKSFDVSIRDSERLMITEVRRIQTEIQKDSFDRNGFKEYRFISAGDGKVCPECERLHGQHFKVSEMQPGENAPPMHPVCRCSTAAWMDGEKYKRWLDALERGEDVRWKEFEAENISAVSEKERLKRSYPNTVQTKAFDAPGFVEKLKGITGNKSVDKAIYESAIEILDHRKNTYFEDIYFLDAATGDIIHKLTTCNEINGVTYDDETNEAIKKAHEEGKRIITIHNHPGGLPPSLDDGVSAHDHDYVNGIVIGHNLEVFRYGKTDRSLSPEQCAQIHENLSGSLRFEIDFDDKEWYDVLKKFGMEVERR